METFSVLLALCEGTSPVTGEFPSQSQWRRPLMFSLICAWTNDWVNNREPGDLRRDCAHYDVICCNEQWYSYFHQWWICPTSLILSKYNFYWETQMFPLASLVNIGVCKNCKSTSFPETLLLHSATKHWRLSIKMWIYCEMLYFKHNLKLHVCELEWRSCLCWF